MTVRMKAIVFPVLILYTGLSYGQPREPLGMLNFALSINGQVKHQNAPSPVVGCQALPTMGSGCPALGGMSCTTKATLHMSEEMDFDEPVVGVFRLHARMPDESHVNMFVQTSDGKFLYAAYLRCSDASSKFPDDPKDGKWYAMAHVYENGNPTYVIVYSDVKEIVYAQTNASCFPNMPDLVRTGCPARGLCEGDPIANLLDSEMEYGSYGVIGYLNTSDLRGLFVQTDDNKYVFANWVKCTDVDSPSDEEPKDARWHAVAYDWDRRETHEMVIVYSDVKKVVVASTSKCPYCPPHVPAPGGTCLPADRTCADNWLIMSDESTGIHGQEGSMCYAKCAHNRETYVQLMDDTYAAMDKLRCDSANNKWYGMRGNASFELKWASTSFLYCRE